VILEADEGDDIGRDDAFEDLTWMYDRGGEAADAHPIDGDDLALVIGSDGEELLTVPGDVAPSSRKKRVDVERRPDRKACNVRQSAVYTPEP